MCGICGQVNGDSAKPVERQTLQKMTQAIFHRGPDSDGFYLHGNVGLAIRRLAVIDLETGDQPISNEDQSIWIVFNGEIYNYREIRSQLIAKNHRFRSNSDTETIVHLYEEYGPDCVRHLRGMFAFAIWDDRQKRLMLARDRIGKKPLFYTESDGRFLFGSEIKCLLPFPGLARKINFEALDHYLTLQYVPDPLTAFEGIFKLPPGHRLLWQNGKYKIERYWDLEYESKLTGNLEDLKSQLLERLKEAVRIRLVSDVPLGIHLSGGIDSSTVAALAAQYGSKIKTFSIGFEEENFSELPYAKTIAEKFSTNHQEFFMSYGNVPALADKILFHFDEPFADPAALPLYFLSQMSRKSVTVALNGDGGDELFAGYPRYKWDPYANYYARLPGFLTQKWIPALLSGLPQPVDIPGERNWIAGLKRLAQIAKTDPRASFVRWGSYFNEEMKSQLWNEKILTKLKGRNTADLLASLFDRAKAKSFLDRTLYADCHQYLPGDLLVKADRMTMAHSLEARSPFLDQELMMWTARLPVSFKMTGLTQKYLLKEALKGLLPDSILKRGKQGFGIPLGAWFRGPLKAWARELLLDLNARVHLYLKSDSIKNLLEEHERGRVNHGNRLWALVMLELWLNQYKPSA